MCAGLCVCDLSQVDAGLCDGGVRSSRWSGNCTLPVQGAEGECSSFSFESNIVLSASKTVFFW